ncbi:hypothetical protein F5H01DRAFT_336217 [Linnemannia elongata]|nr:hypothetical protein F5H01DRAFT_336217 [Linnemannia elongata]
MTGLNLGSLPLFPTAPHFLLFILLFIFLLHPPFAFPFYLSLPVLLRITSLLLSPSGESLFISFLISFSHSKTHLALYFFFSDP